MKKISLISLLVTVFVVLTLLILAPKISTNKKISEANDLIQQIESFRNNYGRLPDSRTELGLEDSETTQPFYQKTDEQNYIIYYSEGFDQSLTYRSETESWTDTR